MLFQEGDMFGKVFHNRYVYLIHDCNCSCQRNLVYSVCKTKVSLTFVNKTITLRLEVSRCTQRTISFFTMLNLRIRLAQTARLVRLQVFLAPYLVVRSCFLRFATPTAFVRKGCKHRGSQCASFPPVQKLDRSFSIKESLREVKRSVKIL